MNHGCVCAHRSPVRSCHGYREACIYTKILQCYIINLQTLRHNMAYDFISWITQFRMHEVFSLNDTRGKRELKARKQVPAFNLCIIECVFMLDSPIPRSMATHAL